MSLPRENETELSRDAQIVRAGAVGIAANVLLAAFKAVVGVMSSSIAIVMDAVNNISDAASSVITIVGTKLARKPPDKDHPFGHGRAEYLSAMVISLLVLYAGATAFTESVRKIIRPETPDYSPASLVIIAAAVAVKILLGRYVKGVGEKTNSESLINSGEDAKLDSVISASTLAAAALYMWRGLSLEAWLGAVIALVIIKSGIEMLRGTISRILGEKAGAELARAIKGTVTAFPGVMGVYDLVLNNYGPDRFNGSIHIEVPDTCTATDIDALTRDITNAVYTKHGVALTGVSIYSANVSDPELDALRRAAAEVAESEPYILEIHGFWADRESKTARADLVVSFDAPDRHSAFESAVEKIRARLQGYDFTAVMDTDFSEGEAPRE